MQVWASMESFFQISLWEQFATNGCAPAQFQKAINSLWNKIFLRKFFWCFSFINDTNMYKNLSILRWSLSSAAWFIHTLALKSALLPHAKTLKKLKKKNNNFMARFYGWGSIASRLVPLRGGSLLFTTKFPDIPGTHFINLGRMKGWVDLGATQWFWTRDPWIRNPAP